MRDERGEKLKTVDIGTDGTVTKLLRNKITWLLRSSQRVLCAAIGRRKVLHLLTVRVGCRRKGYVELLTNTGLAFVARQVEETDCVAELNVKALITRVRRKGAITVACVLSGVPE